MALPNYSRDDFWRFIDRWFRPHGKLIPWVITAEFGVVKLLAWPDSEDTPCTVRLAWYSSDDRGRELRRQYTLWVRRREDEHDQWQVAGWGAAQMCVPGFCRVIAYNEYPKLF